MLSLPVAADDSITKDAATKLLYDAATAPACADIDCLIEHRYADDAKAKKLALELFHASGDLAGVGPDEIMDGSYRGKIHLVPELPIGGYRKHLEWVAAAMTSIDAFFVAQFPDPKLQPRYRWRALGFRFVRSIGKRTPSAYASSWAIEYNVAGSLLTSADGVRETLFHELFHLNDEAHRDWSARTLATDYDAIVRKCGTKVSCLAPYAPNDTMVRGGTYYRSRVRGRARRPLLERATRDAGEAQAVGEAVQVRSGRERAGLESVGGRVLWRARSCLLRALAHGERWRTTRQPKLLC